MRMLVTGASGLVGSNLAAAGAQQSWKVLGTWFQTPVRLPGVRTACLDVSDRHACVALAEEFEPDVLVHAAASVALGRLEREPGLAQLNRLGTEHTLAAARAVRAHYVLVSTDWVFGGQLPARQCWHEHDPTEPVNAYGRSKLAAEHAVQDSRGSWLITRPANVYGVNLAIPVVARGLAGGGDDDDGDDDDVGRVGAGVGGSGSGRVGSGGGVRSGAGVGGGAGVWGADRVGGDIRGADLRRAGIAAAVRARHVWERSSLALRWVAQLRARQPLPAPADVYQSPTYAWDYAQRVCELIAQECEGIYNTAGPDPLSRRDYLRLLARAFDCDPELVREGTAAAFLAACGEDAELKLPANTALCDEQATFVLGRPAIDPLAGHRLMREQLERVLGLTQAIQEVDR
jgi:dTDP-4-dehydrorhamnose reductase